MVSIWNQLKKTKTYIAADWDGDKDAIEQLRKWNSSKYWGLHFVDVHDATSSSDESLNCTIKRSLRQRMSISKTFVLIVGDHTKTVRSGACYLCSKNVSFPTPHCLNGHSFLDNRSYVDYECSLAKSAYEARDIEIVVLYNSICFKDIFLLLLAMEERKDARFKIKDFQSCLSFVEFDDNGLNATKVNSKISEWKTSNIELLNQYTNRFHFWQNKLKELGYEVNDYYQLFNGHGLFDNIAVPLVCHFAKRFRTEMLTKIMNGADSKNRKQELVNEYYNNTFTTKSDGSLRKRVVQLITDNFPCGDNTAATKIKEQIKEALV